MKTSSICALFLTLALPSCGDDVSTDMALGNSSAGPDAAVPLDADLGDTTQHDATLERRIEQDAAADAQIEPLWLPPASPATFKLTLESGPCLGSCPEYRASIDQTGKVEFVGGYCTARPGPHQKQVPPAAAASLYAAFVHADFWTFRDRYEYQDDGCSEVATDASTSDWLAEVDGHVKRIRRYEGCVGIPSLGALDALVAMVDAQTETSGWIHDDNTCQLGAEPVKLANSYKLTKDAQTLGLLTFDDRYNWQLSDCAGAQLLMGPTSPDSGRVVLQQRKQWSGPLDQVPIVLPAGVGAVGSIVIEADGANGLKARGLRDDDEVALTLTEASGC